MTLQRAFEVIRNNENAIENSLLYYLHECSEFNEQVYKEYYQSLEVLGASEGDHIPKEIIDMIVYIHLHTLGCFMYHFDTNDFYEIKFIPKNYSEYIEDINFDFQDIFKKN